MLVKAERQTTSPSTLRSTQRGKGRNGERTAPKDGLVHSRVGSCPPRQGFWDSLFQRSADPVLAEPGQQCPSALSTRCSVPPPTRCSVPPSTQCSVPPPTRCSVPPSACLILPSKDTWGLGLFCLLLFATPLPLLRVYIQSGAWQIYIYQMCLFSGEERGGLDDRKQGPWRANPVPVLRNQLNGVCWPYSLPQLCWRKCCLL